MVVIGVRSWLHIDFMVTVYLCCAVVVDGRGWGGLKQEYDFKGGKMKGTGSMAGMGMGGGGRGGGRGGGGGGDRGRYDGHRRDVDDRYVPLYGFIRSVSLSGLLFFWLYCTVCG